MAVDLAAKDGARALVLESTFSSIPDMAARLYPWFPVRMLVRTKFDSVEKIRDYRGPLLQCHGDADTLVPIEMGRRLFDAAPGPKQFITIPGGDHNQLPPSDYYDTLAEMIRSLP